MYCSECGGELESEDRYCDGCGRTLGGSARAVPSRPDDDELEYRALYYVAGVASAVVALGVTPLLATVTIVCGVSLVRGGDRVGGALLTLLAIAVPVVQFLVAASLFP